MNRMFTTVVAVALLSILPALSIYAGNNVSYTQDQAVFIATQFLKNSPTYSFDGLEETIEVVEVVTMRMQYTWTVYIKFTSRYGGYGDRDGQMLLQALTEHVMAVMVSKGAVTSAVTDELFNELTGTMINNDNPETPKSPGLEAEEIAMEWLRTAPTFSFDGIEDSIRVIDKVILESYPEQYVITISFQCAHPGYGDRSDMILAQVITEHTAVVVVVENTVQSAVIDGEWDEFYSREKVSSELLPPEMALEILLQYLRSNYAEASELEITGDWSISDLTPEGLLGISITEYSGDGWTIKLSHPVVWKPVYDFEVSNESGFSWAGSVDQSSNVIESTE